MTAVNFDTLVTAYTRPFGETYVTAAADKYAVYSRALKRFTGQSLCLYDDRIALTLVANTYNYDLQSASFSRMVALPVHVFIDGNLIEQSTNSQDIAFTPGYLTAAASKPARWFLRPPSTLVLSPKPDAVYSNNYVSGFWLHGLLDADADVLDVLDDDLETAAKACALALLEPWASGPGDMQASYQDLLARYESEKAVIRARAEGYFNTQPIRKGRNPRRCLI